MDEGHVAARRDHHLQAPLRVDAVLRRELGGDALEERRDTGCRVVLAGRGLGERAARGLDRLARGRIVHDALPQRDRAGGRTNHRADRRDDRRLHGVHAGGARQDAEVLWVASGHGRSLLHGNLTSNIKGLGALPAGQLQH
jgi:hypothetical protein